MKECREFSPPLAPSVNASGLTVIGQKRTFRDLPQQLDALGAQPIVLAEHLILSGCIQLPRKSRRQT